MIEAMMRDSLNSLPGWMPTLYWPTGSFGARAVLVHPEYKVQIGCDGATVDEALDRAIAAAHEALAAMAARAKA